LFSEGIANLGRFFGSLDLVESPEPLPSSPSHPQATRAEALPR